MDFVGAAVPLITGDITTEAQKLGVEVAAIWAVCDVESAGSGFLPDKRPKILFEAHAFHTLTHGQYDRAYPNISSASWNRALYGASGDHQFDRLDAAISLDRPAALESASWGRFQIMGLNYAPCGYPDVETYVQAMMDAEVNHLIAFGNFCANTGLVRSLVIHDWSHFALRYNGSGNVADYAGKLASAYLRHAASQPPPAPTDPSAPLKIGSSGPAVMAMQQQLIRLGYAITPDGDFGPHTRAAVVSFQKQHGLVADGVVGPVTMTAIETAAP